MARNGAGTYSLPAGNPVVTGTTISSVWANTTLSDIATALTASIANDGQTPILANQNWGGFSISNVGTLSATTVSAPTGNFNNLIMSQDFQSTGTARRFAADFSNATYLNRFLFQTTTANSNTEFGVIPGGTATQSGYLAFNGGDADNAGFVGLLATATNMRIVSGKNGTGTQLNMAFYASATKSAEYNTSGDWTYSRPVTFSTTVTLGSAAVATTPAATDNDTSVATTAFVGLQKATAVAAFNYRRTTNQTAGTTIIFPTAVYTEYPSAGANYNSATGIFTAPVDGLYHFEAQVTMGNGTGASQQQLNELKISGGAVFASDSTAVAAANTSTSCLSGTIVLTAGQTVIVNNSSPGISGSYIVSQGYFSGHLIART